MSVRIEVTRAGQLEPAGPPAARSRAAQALAYAMPVAYMLPVLARLAGGSDYAALAEAVPLVGVAVSCYLVTHGNPMYAACLLVGT
jgi:hypothetical protein